MLGVALQLKRPLVGIGAPAAIYYPDIARRLGTSHLVPRHAEVCNAVGAVAGGVSQRAQVTITSPEEGIFRLHGLSGPRDLSSLEAAFEAGEVLAAETARALAEAAGAEEIRVELAREERSAPLAGGRVVFVEGRVTARAYGRPRLARSA